MILWAMIDADAHDNLCYMLVLAARRLATKLSLTTTKRAKIKYMQIENQEIEEQPTWEWVRRS